MTVTLTYDNTNARVRIDCNGLTGATALVERSTDLVRWTTVRGGVAAPITAGAIATLDDYEFVPGVTDTYRVTGAAAQTAAVVPNLTQPWLKSVTRPFLNQAVNVRHPDDGGVSRPSRGTVNLPVGRTLGIGVTDVRGGRQFALTLRTDTAQQAQTLDFLLASGDVLYLQAPLGHDYASGHILVDTSNAERLNVGTSTRFWKLPCTQVAAPGPDVTYAIGTWTTVLNSYATWSALLAANPTWGDLLKLIGNPSEVIVP